MVDFVLHKLTPKLTRKLCYHKDDYAMCLIYEYVRWQNLAYRRMLSVCRTNAVSFYKTSKLKDACRKQTQRVSYSAHCAISAILPSANRFTEQYVDGCRQLWTLVSPKFPHVPWE